MDGRMRRVLVTGATGFIGQHVVPALLAVGCEVHTVGRLAPSNPGVSHHVADLLSWDGAAAALAASRADTLLHLAWYVEHGRFSSAPDNLDWIAATLRLARAARAAGLARFVGVGTCMEYDWSHQPGRPRREDDPLAATQLYGDAKIATYQVLRRFFEEGEAGPSFAWGRLFHPFGPGEPPQKLVPALVRTLLQGGHMTIRSGPLLRDFIAVEDVAEALAALAASDVVGPVNIATGEAVRVRDLCDAVAARFGGSGGLDYGAGSAGPEPAIMTADVRRLRQEVGVAPPPPLVQRLASYVDHIRQEMDDVN
jgi:nucleoside-diphosphate-sugar epimerase